MKDTLIISIFLFIKIENFKYNEKYIDQSISLQCIQLNMVARSGVFFSNDFTLLLVCNIVC